MQTSLSRGKRSWKGRRNAEVHILRNMWQWTGVYTFTNMSNYVYSRVSSRARWETAWSLNHCKQARALLSMPLRVNTQNNFKNRLFRKVGILHLFSQDKCWSALCLSVAVESLAAATNSLSNIVKHNEKYHIVCVYPGKCIYITWHFGGKNTFISISIVVLWQQGTWYMERILPFLLSPIKEVTELLHKYT